MATNFLEKLRVLDSERRLHFFEVLAHNLTIAAREAWSDPEISLENQVDSLRKINECLHHVTSRVWVERLNTHAWTDEDFLNMLASVDASLHPKLRGSVNGALAISYSNVTSKLQNKEV